MKALILAAGLGTRLRPFTDHLPKPLFPIGGCPLLDRIIRKLRHAGCEAIMVNTHHLHEQIDAFIARQNYAIPIRTRYEPEILGTGGAIKNASDFWDDRPFMAINSDILTDADLRDVYDFHLNHPHPATLVLHDYEIFNKVSVDNDGFIRDFRNQDNAFSKLAFTGIQVLDPEVLGFMPERVFSSSIDAYESLLADGGKISAFIAKGCQWTDLGTPERYQEAVIGRMAPEAFRTLRNSRETPPMSEIRSTRLKGDGSDRTWYRLNAQGHSVVMADHGIRQGDDVAEVDSFVDIGHHLYDRGLPVPKIRCYDRFSGLVFLEDLGDMSFEALIKDTETPEQAIPFYQSVIDHLIRMSVSGARGFRLSWTYQSARYDKSLILEKECRYFTDAFLKGYLGMDACFEDFEDAFTFLADKALEFSVEGFMHRDMQSRNIMVKAGQFYFIDFQGGRMGPIQYDLASLLIDPYVALPPDMRESLASYCFKKLSSLLQIDPHTFHMGLRYCGITRNLQILGAFAFLSRVKKKTYFEAYIPAALNSLRHQLSVSEDPELTSLRSLCSSLPSCLTS